MIVEMNLLGMVKRELSQDEIDAKTTAVLALLKDQGERMREIEGHKRTIKLIKAKHDSVAGEIELERQHIERGYVWEDPPEPQQELPLEEKEPPRAGQASEYERFEKEYPRSENWPALVDYLKSVLTEQQVARFLTEDDEPIVTWRVDSGVFSAVDNWARIECAHMDASARAREGEPSIAGLTIPVQVPMPELLAEIVLDKPPAKKRARKAASEPAPQA